jgi:D-sedoheptulose 7-phosphate isomerase
MARSVLRQSIDSLRRIESAAPAVAAAAEAAITCLESGGTLYFCGNGGSAADAQHLACELSGRYLIDRPGLPSIALTTNTSALTAIGNDYGYDQVFSRQLEGCGRQGDVLVAITTSGGSANVNRAVEMARRLGMTVIGMTGAKGAAFARRCDFALVTPHLATPRVQEGHIAMGHAWCELIERSMFEQRQAVTGSVAGRAGGRKAKRGAAARRTRATPRAPPRRAPSRRASSRKGRP